MMPRFTTWSDESHMLLGEQTEFPEFFHSIHAEHVLATDMKITV
jgi:hypothetical protein